MAWLTKITCKNCLNEHTLVTEREHKPKLGDKLTYNCPIDDRKYSMDNQGKTECFWEEVISVKVKSQD